MSTTKKRMTKEEREKYTADNQAKPESWPLPVPRLATWKAAGAKDHRGPVVTNPTQVKEYLASFLSGMDKEAFVVIYLDHRNHVLTAEYTPGTVDHAAVYCREVMVKALEVHATGIILAHNHPGGSLEPSEGDKMHTRQVQGACKHLGITVHDHLIATNESFFSFRQSGLL